jgi:NAD(P)H-dependent flavin oxidoreductase YrpB (nitropropane dioxygenase family)
MAASVLRTPICDLLGIEYPILLAGMGPTAGGGRGAAALADLAAAVSNAGGLGVIGGAGSNPDRLREEIRKVRSLTDKPFGVDLLFPSNAVRVAGNGGSAADWRTQIPPQYWEGIRGLREQFGLPDVHVERPRGVTDWTVADQVEVVLGERVPVLAAGLGNPAPYVERCHALGMKVIALVGNTKNARRVAAGGVDIVVAQGTEAGGHTGRIGTMALVPQVVDAVKPVPVVAAGGIADGRGLVAALALGAQAVWCGTAFLATEEANIEGWQKGRIVDATEEDTIVTRLYSGKTMRNITNPMAQAWEASGLKALPMGLQGLLIADLMAAAKAAGKDELLMNAAGQAAGMISRLRPAAEVVQGMVDGAIQVLTEGLPGVARTERRTALRPTV